MPKVSKEIKPIFSRHKNIDAIAFMNWRMDSDKVISLMNMAEGYIQSSILLAEKCVIDCIEHDDKKADIIIFPILANANHGIELYLKAINWMLNILLQSSKRLEGGHDINQIYQIIKSKYRQYGGEKEVTKFESRTVHLSSYLIELYGKTGADKANCKMDFSRYPFDKKTNNHFYVFKWYEFPHQRVSDEVDLINFIKRFEIIQKKLEIISDELYYRKLKQKIE